jgi:heptaprenyl diphosphate synthase
MKTGKALRKKTGKIRGRDLCIAGLIIAPSFLFNTNSYGKIIQFLLFWIAAFFLKKRKFPVKSIVTTLLVMGGVVFFNLLAPYGRALWTFGAFKITEGALWTGIDRAVTLEGLIMLSKASAPPDLRLPGRFGALIGESLRLFALTIEKTEKLRISPKTFIADIDALLFALSREAPEASEQTAAEKSSFWGIAALIGAVLLSWTIFLFPFLRK